jgi:hypothetical protein
MTIDKATAVAIATEVLKADGKEKANYDVSVTDDGDEWEVAFVGEDPRPPGDEVYVYVHKISGTARTMYGE